MSKPNKAQQLKWKHREYPPLTEEDIAAVQKLHQDMKVVPLTPEIEKALHYGAMIGAKPRYVISTLFDEGLVPSIGPTDKLTKYYDQLAVDQAQQIAKERKFDWRSIEEPEDWETEDETPEVDDLPDPDATDEEKAAIIKKKRPPWDLTNPTYEHKAHLAPLHSPLFDYEEPAKVKVVKVKRKR